MFKGDQGSSSHVDVPAASTSNRPATTHGVWTKQPGAIAIGHETCWNPSTIIVNPAGSPPVTVKSSACEPGSGESMTVSCAPPQPVPKVVIIAGGGVSGMNRTVISATPRMVPGPMASTEAEHPIRTGTAPDNCAGNVVVVSVGVPTTSTVPSAPMSAVATMFAAPNPESHAREVTSKTPASNASNEQARMSEAVFPPCPYFGARRGLKLHTVLKQLDDDTGSATLVGRGLRDGSAGIGERPNRRKKPVWAPDPEREALRLVRGGQLNRRRRNDGSCHLRHGRASEQRASEQRPNEQS